MTLRARLALALALLATAAVVAVALIGYVSTSDRLHTEIDDSLRSYAAPLTDPDGRTADAVCHQPGGPNNPGGDVGSHQFGAAVVQCVGADGRPFGSPAGPRLPVDAADKRLAAKGGKLRFRTATLHGTDYRIVTVPVANGGIVQLGRSLASTEHVLDSLRDRYLAIGVGVIAAAALAGWLIARQTARPLRRLTQAAERIAATGRLEADVRTTGRDETSRLARAFVTMLDALTRSREQQQRLAQDAGHELRTPLTSLRTNIDTLRRHRALPDSTRDRVLDDLDVESTELNALVEELVALVIDEPDDEADRPVDLDQLVGRAVERARRRTGRDITLTSEPTLILGKPRHLLRALGNLVDNAVKFSPADTSVDVHVAHGSVSVRDRGPGIAVNDLGRIFDRFYRADAARSLPGSGLGLAIVQQVAVEHGGRVAAANHPDGGAVVTIELRAASYDARRDDAGAGADTPAPSPSAGPPNADAAAPGRARDRGGGAGD